MPPHDNKQSKSDAPRSFLEWLRNNNHSAVYGDWLQYCIDNASSISLEDYVQDHYPEIWRQYSGS